MLYFGRAIAHNLLYKSRCGNGYEWIDLRKWLPVYRQKKNAYTGKKEETQLQRFFSEKNPHLYFKIM